MLSIRLQKTGRKHQLSYRLVVAERRSGLGTPPVENLGLYNPLTKNFEAKKERVIHWIRVGAKPTVTVHNLLIKKGIIEGRKLPVKMRIKTKENISAEKGATAPEAAGAVAAPEGGAASS